MYAVAASLRINTSIFIETTDDNEDDKKGVIIGVVVAAVVLAIVIVVVLGLLYVQHKKKSNRSYRSGTVEPDKGGETTVHQ